MSISATIAGGSARPCSPRQWTTESYLQLWAFRRNESAIAFYLRKGFAPVRETDGSDNEEREPDVLLAWSKTGG